jgi:hypothetical protein
LFIQCHFTSFNNHQALSLFFTLLRAIIAPSRFLLKFAGAISQPIIGGYNHQDSFFGSNQMPFNSKNSIRHCFLENLRTSDSHVDSFSSQSFEAAFNIADEADINSKKLSSTHSSVIRYVFSTCRDKLLKM